MTSIIETEETLAEIRQLPLNGSVRSALASHCDFVHRIRAALTGRAAYYKVSSYEDAVCHSAWETSVNILAREHPYTYIEASAG